MPTLIDLNIFHNFNLSFFFYIFLFSLSQQQTTACIVTAKTLWKTCIQIIRPISKALSSYIIKRWVTSTARS
jgi:hypothetical protein